MKTGKWRGMAFLLLLLCLPLSALASASGSSWLPVEGEGCSVYLPKNEKYTFVTRENLDEMMDICTAGGDSEKDVRMRFANDAVVWEAYRADLPGRLRLEIYEDEWSHFAWDTVTMMDGPFKRLPKYLEDNGWLSNRYHLFNLDARIYDRAITGKLIAYPPYAYESGRFSLHAYNGKFYMLIYCDNAPASSEKHWQDGVYDIVGSGLLRENAFRRDDKALAKSTHMTDLMPMEENHVFNLHPGAYKIQGMTEGNAKITADTDGVITQAKVESLAYEATVELAEGSNLITLTAQKKDRLDAVMQLEYTVNSQMAELVLSQFPYQNTDRNDMKVSGWTSPEGKITLQLDEGEIIDVKVDDKGKFSYTIEVADWETYDLKIVASQEGLEDCTVLTTFTPDYTEEDWEIGMNRYRKTLAEKPLKDVIVDMNANPGDYMGLRYQLEINEDSPYTQDYVYENGYITCLHYFWKEDEEKNVTYYPIQLVFEEYYQDSVAGGGNYYVMGEIIEPTQTEPAIPRMRVQYVYTLVVQYDSWW